MKPHAAQPLPPALDTAVQRLKAAARDAAQRTVESLGLAAVSALSGAQREQMLAAQFELNRKLAAFSLAFNDALDERLVQELGKRVPAREGTALDQGTRSESHWDRLRLVDDGEVEAQLSIDRFAMDVGHQCEWELREVDAYMGSALATMGSRTGAAGEPWSAARADSDRPQRNPIRPEVLGEALHKGVHLLTDREEVQKLLQQELGRSMVGLLRGAYASIVSDWRLLGLRPMSLDVRRRAQSSQSGALHDATDTGRAGLRDGTVTNFSDLMPTVPSSPDAGPLSDRTPYRHGAHASWQNHQGSGHGQAAQAAHRPGTMGAIDPNLTSLIRRLALSNGPQFAAAAAGSPGQATDDDFDGLGVRRHPGAGGAPALPNLIHAHREELLQAAGGALDRMVIDVIGFLFDQILSDPKVPPQMARLLARLQLPVLRAALGDASFFASRRHPVRRFVNRMATLSCAFDDFAGAEAQAFLHKAETLVNDVVEGDFDHIDLYQDNLAALEDFVAQQQAAALSAQSQDAAELLDQQEDEIRLQQLYAERLAGDLQSVAAPVFVLDFLSSVWSQVLLRAHAKDSSTTPAGDLAARLRPVARELVMSVQPKSTPAQRKELLSELPRLMRALTQGMDLVGWPDDQRRTFFGQLMPSHAEALRSTTGRQLDINLTLKQVDGALAKPMPTRSELVGLMQVPVLRDVLVPPQMSTEEAQRIGLVKEDAVQWDGEVSPAPDADGPGDVAEPLKLPGLPTLNAETDTTTPRELADQVQVGFAYQMHLEDGWHKVRVSHVSAGRSFFIFTRGTRHQQTVSMTYRMLLRLCEAERFRAIETRSLIERATARARAQLAALGTQTRAANFAPR